MVPVIDIQYYQKLGQSIYRIILIENLIIQI